MATVLTTPFISGPGIYRGLPNETYHADRSAVSSSQLKVLAAQSPAHFKASFATKNESTESLLFGSAFHCALLEPDEFAERYFVMPDINARTKDGKAKIAALEELANGKLLITREWSERLKGMVASAHKHKAVLEMLSHGEAELAFVWEDPETGILCKIKTDWYQSGIAIWDAKSAADASRDGFSRACGKYSYHLSAAMYRDGVAAHTGERLPWRFVPVEKEYPYACAVYTASEAFLRNGHREFRKALRTLQACRNSGVYPGYQPNHEVEEINLPAWM